MKMRRTRVTRRRRKKTTWIVSTNVVESMVRGETMSMNIPANECVDVIGITTIAIPTGTTTITMITTGL